jgi:hypothetical protein
MVEKSKPDSIPGAVARLLKSIGGQAVHRSTYGGKEHCA